MSANLLSANTLLNFIFFINLSTAFLTFFKIPKSLAEIDLDLEFYLTYINIVILTIKCKGKIFIFLKNL